jgi:D-beta-D-heptose 7-phosphate kinase/D-beta-D-heptose 1-phosphate adenosyltransferase
MITPNKKEYDEICTSDQHPFTRGVKYILKTLGKEGMELMEKGLEVCALPAIPVSVYNVTGAGDTVVAIVSVCIAMGLGVEDATKVANDCAQYVVTQPGTSTVPRKMFKNFVRKSKK